MVLFRFKQVFSIVSGFCLMVSGERSPVSMKQKQSKNESEGIMDKERIIIEYIDYMDAYRVYSDQHKAWTMAYCDSVYEAIEGIREQIDPNARIVVIPHKRGEWI